MWKAPSLGFEFEVRNGEVVVVIIDGGVVTEDFCLALKVYTCTN